MYRDERASCPTCTGVLVSRGTRYECEQCTGELVNPDELADKLRAIAPEDPRTLDQRLLPATGTHRTCPRCEIAMELYFFGTAKTERCQQHGLWFDHGELAIALEHIASAYAKR